MRQGLFCFLSLAVGTLVLFVYSHQRFIRPTDDPKELVLYSGALLFVLGYLIFHRRREHIRLSVDLLHLLVIAYFIYVFFNSGFIADAPQEGFIYLGRLLLICALALVWSLLPRSTLIWVAKGLILAGAAAIVASFVWQKGSTYQLLPIGHISYYSDVALLLIPLSLWFVFGLRPSSRKMVLWVTIAIWACIALFVSSGRASFIGFVVAVVFFASIMVCCQPGVWKSLRFLITMGIVTASTVGILWAVTQAGLTFRPQGVLKRIELTSANASTLWNSIKEKDPNRLEVYGKTLEGWKERPWLGWGYGNFKYVYPKWVQPSDREQSILSDRFWLMHPHNEALFQLFEGGLIGLVLLLSLLAALALRVLRRVKTSGGEEQSLAIAVLCGLVALAVSVQFSTTLTNPIIRLFLALYLAFAIQLSRGVRLLPLGEIKLPRPRYWRIGGVLLCTALGGMAIANSAASYFLRTAMYEKNQAYNENKRYQIARYLSPYTFDTIFHVSSALVKSERYDEAETLLKKGVENFPHVPLLAYKLANLYAVERQYEKAREVLIQTNKQFPMYLHTQSLLKFVEQKLTGMSQ